MPYTWPEVDALLKKWLADPSQLEDDGVDAPTPELLRSAWHYAMFCSLQRDSTPPTAICPTPDGGISFEWRDGDNLEIIEIVRPGVAEFTFISGREVVKDEILMCDYWGKWRGVQTRETD